MRYRIRDLAWLALAIGLALGWYVDRSALLSQRNSLHQQRDALAVRLDEIEERTGTDFDVSLTFDEVILKDFEKDRIAFLKSIASSAGVEIEHLTSTDIDFEPAEATEGVSILPILFILSRILWTGFTG